MILQVLTLLALLGATLVSGTLFGFSSFVMPALARLPAPEAVRAMQVINVAAVRPGFMVPFLGTTLIALVVGTWALLGAGAGGARAALIAGSALYVVGVFAVTAGVHVPRNEALAAVHPGGPEAALAWARYVSAWTTWNHVRAAAGAASALAFAWALRVHSG